MPRELFRATFGNWFFDYQRMNFVAMRQTASDLLRQARREGASDLALQAHHAAWSSSWSTGRLAAARDHAQRGARLYEAEHHSTWTIHMGGHDAGVCGHMTLGMTLCLLGFPEQALEHARAAVVLAERLRHPFSRVLAHLFASHVHQLRGEPDETRACARAARDAASAQNFLVYEACGTVLDGWGGSASEDSGDASLAIERARRGCRNPVLALADPTIWPYSPRPTLLPAGWMRLTGRFGTQWPGLRTGVSAGMKRSCTAWRVGFS
jgi:hypothetical protein